MFGHQKNKAKNLQVVFNPVSPDPEGILGRLLVSNLQTNETGVEITFEFPNVATHMVMTPQLLRHIFEAAKEQGFIPHTLVSYCRPAQEAAEVDILHQSTDPAFIEPKTFLGLRLDQVPEDTPIVRNPRKTLTELLNEPVPTIPEQKAVA